MLPVKPHPEPQQFDKLVRQPGRCFLANTKSPTSSQWSKHNYWKHIHDPMWNFYSGICMYCATFTPQRQASKTTSIDHFKPKKDFPQLAYEWSNYRLCRRLLNHKKDRHTDVLDPFQIKKGWFAIDFDTFLVQPGTEIDTSIAAQVRTTIKRLDLNSTGYVKERLKAIQHYVLGGIPKETFRNLYPFIASEMDRVNFDSSVRPRLIKLMPKSFT